MATAVVTRPAQALRHRRDVQRPGLTRVSTRATTVEAMDSSIARNPTPPVVSEQYILEKFKGVPPSLIVHLHQNHFRFDQQDGNFSYSSPMKIVIQHIKNRTIPHEMLEELYTANVPWYDGHLIVEVQNHRVKGATDGGSTTNQVGATDHVPYSIHNYNEHITPSPFGKFPEHKLKGLSPPTDEKQAEKEKMPAPEQPASAMQKKGIFTPVITRVALGPTRQSQDEEMQLLAMTPYQEPRNDRHGSLAPGTPSLAHPPTPLTSVPPTPKTSNQPRFMLDETNAKEWEAMITNTTAPTLVLGPARNMDESLAVIDMITDPRHCELPPAPKGRKRTVAEMEADEAQAATQERFMLSCDDRHLGMLTSSASGAAGEASRAGAAGEAQFKRFRLIENLKLQQAESKRLEAEKETQRAALKRQQQDAEARKHRELEAMREQQAAQQAAHQQAANQQEYLRQQQMRVQQRAAEAQRAASQQAMQAAVTTSAQQMPSMTSAPPHSMAPTSQPTHMSPVIRQHTPMSGSPTVNGTPMSSAPPTSIPMAVSASNQGAGSPVNRPPSAVPQSMARQVSQHQGSTHGTPQMHSTPSMASAAPVTRHMTPTPRVNQHSSPMPNPIQTPQMTMQMPAQGMTPEQQQALLMRRQAAMNGGQQGMGQMSPQQMAQLMAMRQNQAQMGANPQQAMQMTPQMVAQAQQMRMNQGSPPNPQAVAANQMSQINAQLQALFQNIPQPVQQRLNTLRMQMQNQHAQEEQMRKQQFLTPYQQQGMQPPHDAMQQFQMSLQKQKLDFHVRMRANLMQQRANLMSQYQNQVQAQNGGQPMQGMQASAPQTPQPQHGGGGVVGPNNQQAYMQQLLASQNRMRQQQAMMAANGQNGQMGQGGQMQGMQMGGQQRMVGMPGQGGGQVMMNPQMMQQMNMAAGGGQNFQAMTPQAQANFMQQMQMRAMQQQNGGQNMGNMGMGGMM